MSIGENIRRYRIGKAMTQLELAQAVGVTQPMIAQIERDTKAVTMPLGRDIAQVLGKNIGDLFATEDQNKAG